MLSLTQRTFFGPLANEKNKILPDLNVRETVALVPLLLLVFAIGLFPNVILHRSSEAVAGAYQQYVAGFLESAKVGSEPMLSTVARDPALERGAPVHKTEVAP
jgi:NADH:ubiquinone oxidoreductase subunit 4 (subunit M)